MPNGTEAARWKILITVTQLQKSFTHLNQASILQAQVTTLSKDLLRLWHTTLSWVLCTYVLALLPLHTCIKGTSLVQIMYQNKARLEFNKDNVDDQYDFVISDIMTPDIPWRPHAVSTIYRGDVSHPITCYHHTHQYIIQLGYDKWRFITPTQSTNESSAVHFHISCPYSSFLMIPSNRTISQVRIISTIAVCPSSSSSFPSFSSCCFFCHIYILSFAYPPPSTIHFSCYCGYNHILSAV